MEPVEIDGGSGEGGGQILRTSLALACITGRTLRIARIRARRAKPGLMRQHLTAVAAAERICGARVTGAAIGAQTLEFVPGAVRAGEYEFATGTAGSCTLVLQTVLPVLLGASGPSRLTLRGGTHNPMAPPYPFLERAFLPLLAQMGAPVRSRLVRHGFYPAGGGEVHIEITPIARWQPLELMSRGALIDVSIEAIVAGLPAAIARREVDTALARLRAPAPKPVIGELPRNEGPGNALIITLRYEHVTEVVTAFGAKGVSAETVAENAVREAQAYLDSSAAAGPHLADQLLLPMALAGGGRFTTLAPTPHFTSNAEVIGKFLPVRIEAADDGTGRFVVSVSRTG